MVCNWIITCGFRKLPATGPPELYEAPQKNHCWIPYFVRLHTNSHITVQHETLLGQEVHTCSVVLLVVHIRTCYRCANRYEDLFIDWFVYIFGQLTLHAVFKFTEERTWEFVCQSQKAANIRTLVMKELQWEGDKWVKTDLWQSNWNKRSGASHLCHPFVVYGWKS